MTSAAIYLNPEAYNTGGKALMGRHSAGESFLRGFIGHAQTDAFTFWNVADQPLDRMNAFVQKIEPTSKPIHWVERGDRRKLGKTGVAYIPTPNLAAQSWWRRPYGAATYALCGITHTTAEHAVLDMISDLMIAPVEPWDALICTSAAVRRSTETQLNATCAYLSERFGTKALNTPLLDTIPLGINTSDFKQNAGERSRWRRELDIPDDAIVALYVGRFSREAKMNPVPMAIVMEHAAKALDRPLYWVMSGWAPAEDYAAQYHADTHAACPSVHYRVVDGRRPDVRFSIWSVADFFLSLSDNVQETYGLTPLEAMAAGLPCVVSDWDGYRETVRHGVDGFRIATYCPPSGTGRDLAYNYAQGWMAYSSYVGSASQMTAIDISAAAEAIVALASDRDLRLKMGAAGQQHARCNLDWKALVPRYEALWSEQNARRLQAAGGSASRGDNPWRADPFQTFASYPTEALHNATMISVADGMTWPVAQDRLSLSAAPYVIRFMPDEAQLEQLFSAIAAQGAAATGEVLAAYPEGRRPLLMRAILWFAKYGIVRIFGAIPALEG